MSSFKFKRKWKVRVLSHASVSKYYADKCKFAVHLVTSNQRF